MTICLNTVLPQNSSVTLNGYFVTVIDGDNQYRYDTEYTLQSDKEMFTSNDYIKITKNGDSLIVNVL